MCGGIVRIRSPVTTVGASFLVSCGDAPCHKVKTYTNKKKDEYLSTYIDALIKQYSEYAAKLPEAFAAAGSLNGNDFLHSVNDSKSAPGAQSSLC